VPEHAADSIRCARCQHDLAYTSVYISHLGAFRCPGCGYARPRLDIAVTRVQLTPTGATHVTMETPVSPLDLYLPLPGLHNVYNAAATIAAAVSTDLDLSLAAQALAAVRPAFGRLEEITAGERRIVLAFVKNPISYNTTLRSILQCPGPKHVLAAHSNTSVDGEDFAWLWDVDLEELAPQVASLVTGGTKAEELALRYKYAGVPEERMRVIRDLPTALDAALGNVEPGALLYILSGYTQTRALRGVMQQRGWVPPFWEE
jgi:UDP-N-acetylmuramyl tripeptide synthase